MFLIKPHSQPNIFKEEELDDINHISIFWRTMNKDYPEIDDPYHFSEEGHKYLADKLYQYIKDNNILL
jgi:lysophospholipase L1-like esterase